MDGSYPLSIVVDGMALNITLVTYGQNVDFGIIACRRSMPQVQRLIDYMEDALVELEDAAGLSKSPDQPRSKPAGKAGRKAKPRVKVKTKSRSGTASKSRARKKAAG